MFSQGFRPFFLGAGIWSLIAAALWMPLFMGILTLPSAFDPVAWHAHEMIFGFVGAVIAGFLLTAIPNWTGRLPLSGTPLIVLVALWGAGRIAMAFAAEIGPVAASVVDLAFLPVLFALIVREIVAGRNWRNLPMTVAVLLLFTANLLMHLELLEVVAGDGLGLRMAVAVILMLIGLIGGRVIPSFTRNWLAKQEATHLPAPFGRFDGLSLMLQLVALTGWVFLPSVYWVGWLLIVSGAVVMFHLVRWRGFDTSQEPLVWSLHLGFLWLSIGQVLLGLSAVLADFSSAAGIHALTAGAMGSMTLAVMTRAILGHTGRTLTADGWTTAIYLLAPTAALMRIAAVFLPASAVLLYWASIGMWCAAFIFFVLRFGRLMLVK